MNRGRQVTEARVSELAARLSPTELAVIETLDRVRLASALQLQALHATGSGSPATLARRMRRTLARLERLSVLARLERRIGGVRAGSAGYVYALDVAGQRLASACGPAGGRRIRRPWTPGGSFIAHTLDVTELYVGLRRREDAGDLALLGFDAEPLCWRTFAGLGGGRACLKPDAFVRAAAAHREYFSFVEVDRATHSAPALGRKLTVYRRYLASGRDQARFGLFPQVTIVVPDKRRKQVAVDVCSAQPADSWPLWRVVLASDAVAALSGGSA